MPRVQTIAIKLSACLRFSVKQA